MITVQVKKNQIVATKSKLEPMTSGSQSVYPVQFLFSQEWTHLAKVAVFTGGLGKDGPTDTVYNVLLDDNDRCFIPWEVNLSHSQHVYVGVYGTMDINKDQVILPTAWADLGNVVLGVTTGLDSEPPTPDIHDQILSQLQQTKDELKNSNAELKDIVAKYQQDVTNYINQYQANTTAMINTYQTTLNTKVDNYQQDVTSRVDKYEKDTNAKVDKFQTDLSNKMDLYQKQVVDEAKRYHDELIGKVDDYQKETSDLFLKTAERIRDEALGKIAAIQNVVDEFTNQGIQIINGATIIRKDQFPDKTVPTDTDGDGSLDKDMPIPKFPRAYILTNTTIASNAEETSRSWSFLNEIVYVKEGVYIDKADNPIDAIFVTDMQGKTCAFLTDEFGNFNHMIEVLEPPVKYEDIVGTPDISDVTRTKCIGIILKAQDWIQTIAGEKPFDGTLQADDSEPDDEKDEDELLPSTITQTVGIFGISANQRDQLIIPVPRDDNAKLYYNSDIVIVGQEENHLHFQARDGVPTEDIVVYIYIINSTSYQWVKPPEPDDTNNSCCTCCPDYEFEEGLVESELTEDGKVFVRLETVDDFSGNNNLPMSANGVLKVLGNIERLLDNL